MAQTRLTAADGFELTAYVAEPPSTPKGCVLILPEIFGVNSHIRSVTDRYAARGYLAVAPAMFDRVQQGLELGYSDEEVKRGQALMREVDWDDTLLDMTAAARFGEHAGKVGIVGFCWGGTAAWVAASRGHNFACAVSYYGNAIPTVLGDCPRIPMMLHWGEQDHLIGLDEIRRIQSTVPSALTCTYKTGHGFNCDQRPLYHRESAALAEQRTLDFLRQHVDVV
jgi:carboxymethylenebutenolidase